MNGQDLVIEGLSLAALLALPVAAANLVAGLIAGALQSLTGWQDAALSQVPRLIITVLVLVPAVPWMAEKLVAFTRLAWGAG